MVMDDTGNKHRNLYSFLYTSGKQEFYKKPIEKERKTLTNLQYNAYSEV